MQNTLLVLFLSLHFIVCSQNRFDKVNITTQQLSKTIYMLTGAGGNIGASIGDDGILLVDNQFSALSDKIKAALQTLSSAPVKIVINTHHHQDHTGGNINFSASGALIMAHHNVKERLKAKPSNTVLPAVTYKDKLHIEINNEDVFIVHVNHAHTDGDSMLFFTDSNVLHTGDVYFNGRYPYIDLSAGGTIDGYIAAVSAGLLLADDDTKIIPGHGALSNKKEYKTFLKMLKTLKASVLIEISKGKTENEVAANTAITKIYDDLGYDCCFVSSETIRRTFYKGLKR